MQMHGKMHASRMRQIYVRLSPGILMFIHIIYIVIYINNLQNENPRRNALPTFSANSPGFRWSATWLKRITCRTFWT